MLLSNLLPIFGLILAGWAAAASGLVPRRVGAGLSTYVFSLAVPALIVSSLTRPDIQGDLVPGYWVAYFGGCGLAWLGCALLARWRNGLGRREGIMEGFAASSANTVFLGVPIILQVYGEDGMMPLFMLLAVHLPLMLAAATLLLEVEGGGSLTALARKLFVVLGRNPIFLSLLAGLLARWLGWQPQGGIKSVLDAVGGTASTCALLALGMGMRQYRLLGSLGSATRISIFKLVVHPLMVWLLAFHVLDMPPAYAGVATLFAAMPAGINAYLLAARYREAEAGVASAVVLSTLAAAVSVPLWLWVLGR